MYSRFMQRDGRMVNGGKLGDFYQKAKSKRDLNTITLYDHDIGLCCVEWEPVALFGPTIASIAFFLYTKWEYQ